MFAPLPCDAADDADEGGDEDCRDDTSVGAEASAAATTPAVAPAPRREPHRVREEGDMRTSRLVERISGFTRAHPTTGAFPAVIARVSAGSRHLRSPVPTHRGGPSGADVG
jgi:hypothetical protein